MERASPREPPASKFRSEFGPRSISFHRSSGENLQSFALSGESREGTGGKILLGVVPRGRFSFAILLAEEAEEMHRHVGPRFH